MKRLAICLIVLMGIARSAAVAEAEFDDSCEPCAQCENPCQPCARCGGFRSGAHHESLCKSLHKKKYPPPPDDTFKFTKTECCCAKLKKKLKAHCPCVAALCGHCCLTKLASKHKKRHGQGQGGDECECCQCGGCGGCGCSNSGDHVGCGLFDRRWCPNCGDGYSFCACSDCE